MRRPQSTADDFKKQRETEFSYITPSNFRENVTPEQMADAVVSSLKNERVMDEYLGAMHANGVDVNKDEASQHHQRLEGHSSRSTNVSRRSRRLHSLCKSLWRRNLNK